MIWNSLGHLYQEGVDEAINIVQDEDNAHLAESQSPPRPRLLCRPFITADGSSLPAYSNPTVEARPAEIKRARKKAIQLAQKEVAEVHEEVSVRPISSSHSSTLSSRSSLLLLFCLPPGNH